MDDLDIKLDKFFTNYSMDMKMLFEKLSDNTNSNNYIMHNGGYSNHMHTTNHDLRQTRSILNGKSTNHNGNQENYSCCTNTQNAYICPISSFNKKMNSKNYSYSSINEENLSDLLLLEEQNQEEANKIKLLRLKDKITQLKSKDDEDDLFEDFEYVEKTTKNKTTIKKQPPTQPQNKSSSTTAARHGWNTPQQFRSLKKYRKEKSKLSKSENTIKNVVKRKQRNVKLMMKKYF